MSWELAQDAIVTLAALAAAAVLVRQVLTLVWSKPERHACTGCPANRSAPPQFVSAPTGESSRRLRVLP